MFRLWNIKFLRFNYKLTYQINYGIEIHIKKAFNHQIYIGKEALTINYKYYKFHNSYI